MQIINKYYENKLITTSLKISNYQPFLSSVSVIIDLLEGTNMTQYVRRSQSDLPSDFFHAYFIVCHDK